MEEVKDKLREFNYYKQLILNDQTNGRNTIVERKDGSHAIVHEIIKERPIPGLATTIGDIERITVFIGDREYEFVACDGN